MAKTPRARSKALRPLPRGGRVTCRVEPRLRFLYEPRRYKVLYGGRGGGKSWAAARALLALAARRPMRVLCAREFRASMRDSAHRLLSDQVAAMGLEDVYSVSAEGLKAANGSEFVFAGVGRDLGHLRSKEGFDVCWVEEGQALSRAGWDVLIPTIRKPGSEIWVTFNPELEEDEAWRRFVLDPPSNATVLKMGFDDNPHLPDVLMDEQADLKRRDPAAWAHVWDGQCRPAVEGAVYGAALAKAQEEGRIGRVPHDPSAPVQCFWDLGWSDSVSVWMAQAVGLEFRVIDFLQASQQPIDWYVRQLQTRPYVWGEDFLPHDAEAKTLAAGGRTLAGQMRGLGRRVRRVEQVPLTDGVNAARQVMERCWFDQDRCAEGLRALRHYRYEPRGEGGELSRRPVHDWSSHAADAFRYLAVSLDAQRPKKRDARERGRDAWMG